MGATLQPLSRKKCPGPADYRMEDVSTKRLLFSFRVAILLTANFLPQVTINRRRAPKFAMGIYHSQYKGEFSAKYYDDL